MSALKEGICMALMVNQPVNCSKLLSDCGPNWIVGWLYKFWQTAGVIVRVIRVLVSINGFDWWVSVYCIVLVGQYDFGLVWL